MADPEAMNEELKTLQGRLLGLEEQIAETRRRLPAHSVKPPVMMDLLALEDERDLLLGQIEEMRRR